MVTENMGTKHVAARARPRRASRLRRCWGESHAWRRPVTHTDPPALTDIELAMTPAEALGAAITREYLILVRNAEVQAAKSGLLHAGQTAASLADELLSDAIAKALERADRWNPDGPAWPWIGAFVANSIRDRIRARTRHRARVDERAVGGQHDARDLGDTLVDPASLAPDHLFELLDLVDEPHRSVLRMDVVDRLTGAEIAQQLGVSPGTARVRLTRARQKFDHEYRVAQQGGRS